MPSSHNIFSQSAVKIIRSENRKTTSDESEQKN